MPKLWRRGRCGDSMAELLVAEDGRVHPAWWNYHQFVKRQVYGLAINATYFETAQIRESFVAALERGVQEGGGHLARNREGTYLLQFDTQEALMAWLVTWS